MAASEQTRPVWLITGCSTGFGRELARVVLEAGHRAAVTARNAERVADLVEGHPDSGLTLALDVTDRQAVRHAVQETEARFGRVDVLVNNAGYGYLAAVEEGEDSQVRAMFETNFFGLVAMTQAVLPGMRERGRGHIVNISSVGGLVGNPGSGFYAATKFAVEGLADSLSKEVTPLGIKVTLVEPGPFRTDWAGRSLRQTEHSIEAYAETAGARRAQTSGYSGKQPGDPVRAAKAIMQVVAAEQPPLHLVLGKPGLEMVRKKLDALHQDLAAWEEVTLSADYPEDEQG